MAAAETGVAGATNGPVTPMLKRIPSDLVALAGLTATLWVITVACRGFDADALFRALVPSETAAWIFALTLAPLWALVAGIASAWGAIVTIPTCLLAVHLPAWRLAPRPRWLIAGAVTAALVLGVPFALNRAEEARLSARYAAGESPEPPSFAGRAVELAQRTPFRSTWRMPISCPSECTDLLVFGKARSVTLSYPSREDAAGGGPVAVTYRIGPAGPGCAGEPFEARCPHVSSEAIPADRLVLTIDPVAPMAGDSGRIVARRLTIRDTRRRAGRAVRHTRFTFAGYRAMLNPVWRGGTLRLSRRPLPLFAERRLDGELFRSVVPKALDGAYYPFR